MVDPSTNIAASNRATVLAMNIEQAQEDKGNRLYDSEKKRYRTWVDKNDPDRAKFALALMPLQVTSCMNKLIAAYKDGRH